MRARLGRVALRTAWLLVGAAIGLASALLLVGLAQVVGPRHQPAQTLVTVLCLLPVVLLGLLPGVRELEVTAARALLGIGGDLVVPASADASHRLRTVAVVLLHLALGLLAATLLVGVVPGTIAWTSATLRHQAETLAGIGLPALAPGAAGAVGLAVVLGCLGLTWLLGRAATAAVARLLGPTASDLLAVALARLEAEAQHTRLARELHDGIGHALSIINVQAAAGRRSLEHQPDRVAGSLSTIEETARQALGELDDVLGLLRAPADLRPLTPDPGLERLPALLATHRSGGLPIDAHVDPPDGLPRLQSVTAYRIVAEGLTNAVRYAAPGPVHVAVRVDPDALRIRVDSPRAESARAASGGRGLAGIAEWVALFGGRVTAGPQDGRWVLAADLPRPRTRGGAPRD